MKRMKAITVVLLAVLFCFAATAMAGEFSFYDSANEWIVNIHTKYNDPADGKYSMCIKLLDRDTGASVPVAEILKNGQMPSANPFCISVDEVVDEISGAYNYVDNGTELFVFGVHVLGQFPALHNHTIIARLWPGAHCGSAAGIVSATEPTSNLCQDGSLPPVISGSGTWTWRCAGIGDGEPVDCEAPKPVDGVCGSANGQPASTEPTSNLCGDGSLPPVYGGSTGPWSWECAGTPAGVGRTASCSATVRPLGDPDLTITGLSGLSSGFYSGQNLQVTITVSNRGNASTAAVNTCANKQIALKMYQGSSLMGTQYVNDMAEGEQQSRTFSFVANTSCSIHSYCAFIAEVDANKCVAESDEANNSGGRLSLRSR